MKKTKIMLFTKKKKMKEKNQLLMENIFISVNVTNSV